MLKHKFFTLDPSTPPPHFCRMQEAGSLRVNPSRKTTRGFTLIELMVVVSIIGVLAAVLVPGVSKLVDNARVSKTAADLTTIRNAMDIYLADVGSYPPSVQDWGRAWGADVGLSDRGQVHSSHVSVWHGPYLKDWPTKTAWGGPVGCAAVGAYYVHIPIGWIDKDGIPGNDYWIHMDPGCVRYPTEMASAIDTAMDDGDPGAGNVRIQGPTARRYVYYYVGEGSRNW